jgi:hypothetical protein
MPVRLGARAALRAALVVGVVAASLLGVEAARAVSPDDFVFPIGRYTSADARALAEAHDRELKRLYAEVRRCLPAIGFEKHGIAFRRPRGAPDGKPSLTLWVWLDAERPAGADYGSRARRAFGRYGQPLVRQLLARSPVFADGRVGGYALIITWFGPGTDQERLVGESLAVFADKVLAANFANDTIGPATFLERAQVRAFDGPTELAAPRLGALDDVAPAVAAC